MTKTTSTVEADGIDAILVDWERERPELDPSTLSVFGRLPLLVALQRAVQNANYKAHGLSLPSFDVLANLRRSGAPHRKTAGELASSSMLTTGGITFRMDKMEAHGLIDRVRTADDRRVVYAQLTARGKGVIDAMIATHFDTQQKMLSNLTADEAIQLSALLKKVELSIGDYGRQLSEPVGPDET